jgi:hypothetical protein
MVGSAAIGSWIAHAAFWILLAIGATVLRARHIVIFVALWLVGYIGVRELPTGSSWFMSYVAVLDIALVLVVFKGDLRIT